MSRLARFVEERAREALEFELSVSPKPGLVNMLSNGAHADMSADTLKKGISAIAPHIGRCAEIGFGARALSPDVIFALLVPVGVSAQRDMLRATGGVNTHKGGIFCLGLLACAFGAHDALPADTAQAVRAICHMAGRICGTAMTSQINEIKLREPRTNGERALREAGLEGARGEAGEGYPSIVNCAYPEYARSLRRGYGENDAGARALLALIALGRDTCLYARGGAEGLRFAREGARRALDSGANWRQEAKALDAQFIRKNLSPGGCADLLCATRFLAELTRRDSPAWEDA